MSFNVKNKRLGTGRYEFSYGKGKKKLTAGAWNNDVAGGWQVDAADASAQAVNKPGPYKTLKDLKAAWGAWAQAAYGGGGGSGEKKGPPSHKPKSPGRAGPPRHRPKVPKNLDFQFAADPFDPRYKYPSDHEDERLKQRLTPLGVLVEISAWAKRHKDYPDSFKPLIESVHGCLIRELELESE